MQGPVCPTKYLMALDVQRNWDVAMAENLERLQEAAEERAPDTKSIQTADTLPGEKDRGVEQNGVVSTGSPVYLPDEIIVHILEYVLPMREAQRTLASCCLLSHQWYDAAVPLLYQRPHLYGKNFDPFARTVCPSINLHVRKSPLSGLVKVLDLGSLVHQGSKSMTARLLGRTKEALEVFKAPQASFAINCLPALAKCHKLRSLDLSLVSESPHLPELFRTVAHLQGLRTFRLPRSSGFGAHDEAGDLPWPPRLEELALSGGIDAHFLYGIVKFPETLRSISIEHCPLAKGHAVTRLLVTSIRPLARLESLKISNMPRLSFNALDGVIALLPQLKRLSVSVDYITPAVFDDDVSDPPMSPDIHPTCLPPSLPHKNLHTLELTNSGNPNEEDKITPIDILIAIDNGALPALRVVRIARSLHWQGNPIVEEAEALAGTLQEASKQDWENRQGVFADMNTSQWKEADWTDAAGVWQFDG